MFTYVCKDQKWISLQDTAWGQLLHGPLRFYRVNVAAHHLMAAAAAAAWSTENLYVGEHPRDFSGKSTSVLKAPSQAVRKNELERVRDAL